MRRIHRPSLHTEAQSSCYPPKLPHAVAASSPGPACACAHCRCNVDSTWPVGGVCRLDFYGRPSDAIWFYIPHPNRKRIVVFMLLSVFFHLVLQGARFYWNDYTGSHEYPVRRSVATLSVAALSCVASQRGCAWRRASLRDYHASRCVMVRECTAMHGCPRLCASARAAQGTVVINIALVFTIGFGIGAGVYQGYNEEKLRKERPDAFAPAFTFYLSRGLKTWRQGGQGSLREVLRVEYELFMRVQRMQTVSGSATGAFLGAPTVRRVLPLCPRRAALPSSGQKRCFPDPRTETAARAPSPRIIPLPPHTHGWHDVSLATSPLALPLQGGGTLSMEMAEHGAYGVVETPAERRRAADEVRLSSGSTCAGILCPPLRHGNPQDGAR